MAWFIQPLEIAGPDGKGTGKWRLTATSDEDGGGPFGLNTDEHEHASPVAARGCPECRDYCDRIAGFYHPENERKRGAELIVAERWRQVEVEGWTKSHDDGHDLGEMLEAAVAYTRAAQAIYLGDRRLSVDYVVKWAGHHERNDPKRPVLGVLGRPRP